MVSLLRGAGAIILGHANMSEWASVRTSKYSTGYSARGGQVRNPYNLSSSPCKFSNELEQVSSDKPHFLPYSMANVSPQGVSCRLSKSSFNGGDSQFSGFVLLA